MPTSPAVLPHRLLRDQESLKEAPLRVPANQLIVLSRTAQPEQRLAARTWNAFGGLLGTLSASLGIDPGAALAVMCVEAGGRCFGADGRLVIRFENHVFWQRCGGLSPDNEAAFHRHFRFDPRKKWLGHGFRTEPAAAWTAVHRSQASEWQALELA